MDPKLCEEAFNLTTYQNECPLWHELRYGRIGASVLKEASSCQTQGYLVDQMLGAQNAFESKAMVRGRMMESNVADAASKYFSRSFRKCGICLNANHPIFAASPDRVCDDLIVEIKCPIKESTVKNYVFEGKIAMKVKMQMQLQMHMMGIKKGLLCVASPSFERDRKFTHQWEEYDGDFIKNVMNRASSFWEKCIFPKFKQVYN